MSSSGGSSIGYETNIRTLITTMVVAVVFVGVRVVARWKAARLVGIEDYFCWAAVVFFLGYCSIYFTVLDTAYLLQDPDATLPPDYAVRVKTMLLSVLAIQVLFWSTLWSVKLSLLLMFRRLTDRVPLYARAWNAVLGFTVLAWVGCLITIATACEDVKHYGTPGTCTKPRDIRNQLISLYYGLAVDVLTDFLIMAIPISLIWNLQMNTLEKIGLGIGFCAGIATVVAAFIRAFTLQMTPGGVNLSWLAFWAAIEGCIAVAVNCIPSFAIFVRSTLAARKTTYGSQSAGGYGPMGSGSALGTRRKGGAVMAMGPVGREGGAVADGERYMASVSVGVGRRERDLESSSQESIMRPEAAAKEVYVTRTVEVS